MDIHSAKRLLEQQKCKTHNSSPKVEITSGNLSINCCCEDFRKELITLFEKSVVQSIKNIFKR